MFVALDIAARPGTYFTDMNAEMHFLPFGVRMMIRDLRYFDRHDVLTLCTELDKYHVHELIRYNSLPQNVPMVVESYNVKHFSLTKEVIHDFYRNLILPWINQSLYFEY